MEDHLDSAFDKCYSNKYFDDEFDVIRMKSAFKSGYNYAISHLWNSVSELLPKYDEVVIVKCSKGVIIAYRVDLGVDNWISEETGLAIEINNDDLWMEIPSI